MAIQRHLRNHGMEYSRDTRLMLSRLLGRVPTFLDLFTPPSLSWPYHPPNNTNHHTIRSPQAMENRPPLLPSPELLSSPMLPTSKFDYFHQSQEDPEKRVHFTLNEKKRLWQFSSGTPSPSSTMG